MIRFFLYALLALLAGALVALIFARDPGYVLISWGDYSVETSVLMAIISLVLVILIVRSVIRLIRLLNPSPLFAARRRKKEP